MSDEPQTIELKLDAKYHGISLSDSKWDWPDTVRAAILLCDRLATQPNADSAIFVPGLLSIDSGGQLVVQSIIAKDAGPFAAPEIVDGKPSTEASQAYNIASVTHYLLLGYPPLGNLRAIELEAPETPSSLRQLLINALAVDPEQRISSIADLRRELFYILAPPTWTEKVIPKLPVDDENKLKLSDLNRHAQKRWYQARDSIPWKRVGQGQKQIKDWSSMARVRKGITIGGMIMVILIYLALFTNWI